MNEEDKKEVQEVYKLILENLEEFKKGNKNFDYSIETYYELFGDILKMFKTKDERLKALIMIYTYNVSFIDLDTWSLQDLKDYIYETEDDKYFKGYEELFKLIERGEE